MIVKIQHRRGAYAYYDPTKVLPGEIAVVQSDDPNSEDGKAIYIGTTAGDVKKLVTENELESEVATGLARLVREEIETIAQAAIADIEQDVEDASDYATLSQSYAKGGTNSRTGEDTDNAKYYKEQAASSASTASSNATAAANSASSASTYASNASRSASNASTYASNASTSATTASEKATQATEEAENAEEAATIASTAAQTATQKASAASSSASTATAKANEAASSASSASGSAQTATEKASVASESASAAASSATTATNQAKLAESYAKGGTNTRTGEDTDNAKYYKEQAAISAAMLNAERLLGNFAKYQSNLTASKAYKVGEYLTYNGYLYRVTTAIASGGTITPGTNCVQTNVGEEVANYCLRFENVAVSAATGDIATITDARITADHVVAECVWGNSSAITTDVTCTTSAGSAVLNGTCTVATTATVTLVKKCN